MSLGAGWQIKSYRRNERKLRSLLRRYYGQCAHCGCHVNRIHGDPRQATRDHVIPKSRGGTNDLGNLQLLCRACNVAKGNKLPTERAQSH